MEYSPFQQGEGDYKRPAISIYLTLQGLGSGEPRWTHA